MDDAGRVLTDEQLVRQIAHWGSLEAACSHSNVRLIEQYDGAQQANAPSCRGRKRRLSDYLSEEPS